MGRRVERIKTDVSEPQMAQALIEAWQELFHQTPTKDQVSLILAQNALETGHRQSMWNFNIGNITTDGKGSYDFFDDLTTKEQTKPGVWKSMNLKYRAYPSLIEGAKDYLKLLSGKHYFNAWQHIINPDPIAFSKALKQSGYYTADEKPYSNAVSKLYGRFSKSKSYDLARANQVEAPKSYLVSKEPAEDSRFQNIMNLLNVYLNKVIAADRSNSRLYKKYLPSHYLTIQVFADSLINGVEFARILGQVLDTELMVAADTYLNDPQIEVQCCFQGDQAKFSQAIQQLTQSTVEAFELATKKIGGIKVATNFTDKNSNYQPINAKYAYANYRRFVLQFKDIT